MSELIKSKLSHYNWDGSELEPIDFLFTNDRSSDLSLSRVVAAEASNLRHGNGSSKSRGEVKYSTRKLYRQKGTGNSRAGSAGSGTRYHGGVIFGPTPRSFYQKVNKKEKRKALATAFFLKSDNNNVLVVSGDFGFKKTREAETFLKSINIHDDILLVTGNGEDDKRIVFRNLSNVAIVNCNSVTLTSVLKYAKIVFTESAAAQLSKRLSYEG